ncbi:hypothetical protein U1Q18_042519 [Sarracenia purpurea var. burkii]
MLSWSYGVFGSVGVHGDFGSVSIMCCHSHSLWVLLSLPMLLHHHGRAKPTNAAKPLNSANGSAFVFAVKGL